jgi:hypothetical protein
VPLAAALSLRLFAPQMKLSMRFHRIGRASARAEPLVLAPPAR